MNVIIPQDYYTYLLNRPAKPDTPAHLINPDGTVPFYVGKGRGARVFQHEWCARRTETCRHITCRVIRKVLREGGQITKIKESENLTEQEAHGREIELIAHGRNVGWPLVNLTDGGEGISGYKGDTHPPSQREKHRKRLKEYYASDPALIERQRQQQLNRWANNPQERERHRLVTMEAVAKAGKANIGNSYNAKTYKEGFQSPTGEIFTNIHHLKAFCKEHRLNSAHMGNVYKGTRTSHKGWTRYPPLEKEEKPTYAKAGFRDPQGNIYEAEDIPNLAEFCRKHKLTRTCMVYVGDGTLHSHKEWTRYPEIKAQRDYHGTYTGPALLSPEGTVYTPEEIDNLTAFSHTHDLHTSSMSLVSQGKQTAHKGWTRYPPLEKPPKFSFKSPDGTVHHIVSLRELCTVHGLNESCMSQLHAGKLHAHKGWTKYNSELTQDTLF